MCLKKPYYFNLLNLKLLFLNKSFYLFNEIMFNMFQLVNWFWNKINNLYLYYPINDIC
jgi:hypothetical protein